MKKGSVIIVDDDRAFAKVLRGMLEHEGYTNITECEGGSTCFSALSHNKADYIFLDFSLHGLNGLDILKKVKQSHKAKVFIVTSLEDTALANKCIEAGASAYINKAEIIKEFPHIINEHMKKSFFFWPTGF